LTVTSVARGGMSQTEVYFGNTLHDTVDVPRKDPITGTPGTVKIRLEFTDFLGTYVEHCHILVHEDHGMMSIIEVAPEAPIYAVGADAGGAPEVKAFDPVTGAQKSDF